MSREIKFRGKRLDNGHWSTGDLIQLLGEQGRGRKFIVDNRFGACIDNNGDFVNTEAPFVNEVDPETIGEYTGLKDKNGKEIYEGDILKLTDADDQENTVITQLGYDPGVFWVDVSAFTSEYDYTALIWADRFCEIEVIGNIYQDGDLLATSTKTNV